MIWVSLKWINLGFHKTRVPLPLSLYFSRQSCGCTPNGQIQRSVPWNWIRAQLVFRQFSRAHLNASLFHGSAGKQINLFMPWIIKHEGLFQDIFSFCAVQPLHGKVVSNPLLPPAWPTSSSMPELLVRRPPNISILFLKNSTPCKKAGPHCTSTMKLPLQWSTKIGQLRAPDILKSNILPSKNGEPRRS